VIDAPSRAELTVDEAIAGDECSSDVDRRVARPQWVGTLIELQLDTIHQAGVAGSEHVGIQVNVALLGCRKIKFGHQSLHSLIVSEQGRVFLRVYLSVILSHYYKKVNIFEVIFASIYVK